MSEENGTKRIALVASKGTMDMAYPPLILASTAVALGWEGAIFFTFYGLDIIKKAKLRNLKVPSVGNPAMPVPVPTMIGALPGMTAVATSMMKSWVKKANVATIPELLEVCQEGDIKLFGCQMTMDLMGVKAEDLVEGTEVCGAANFLEYASESDIQMFI